MPRPGWGGGGDMGASGGPPQMQMHSDTTCSAKGDACGRYTWQEGQGTRHSDRGEGAHRLAVRPRQALVRVCWNETEVEQEENQAAGGCRRSFHVLTSPNSVFEPSQEKARDAHGGWGVGEGGGVERRQVARKKARK